MRTMLAAGLTALLMGAAAAQEAEPAGRPEADEVEPDRSAFTPATSTVGRGRWVLEASGSYIDFRRGNGQFSWPETLLRYGLTERFELQLGYNLETNRREDPFDLGVDVAGTIVGVGSTQFSYGFKYQLTDQDGLTPRSGFIAQGYTPLNGEDQAGQVAVGYVFGWELPNRWRLDSGLRFNTNRFEDDGYQVWANTHVLRVPVTDRLGVNLEYFGLYSADKERDFVRPYVSNGYTLLLTPDLEVGLRVGVALNRQSPPFFVNTGFGWRF